MPTMIKIETSRSHRKYWMLKCILIMTFHLFFSNISHYNVVCRHGLDLDSGLIILIKPGIVKAMQDHLLLHGKLTIRIVQHKDYYKYKVQT